ncbi:MAG: hypothetical protein AB7T22_08440 [Calditrichaceae bacterium]
MTNKNVFISGILILLLIIFAGCRKENRGYLIGEWSGVDKMGIKQTFVFMEDNRAEWKLKSKNMTQTFEIEYKIDFDTCPVTIDLSGFNEGPLAGKALYGIIEHKNNAMFRLDVEPGEINKDQPIHRPSFFGEETVTYYRVK